jgi:protein TonB
MTARIAPAVVEEPEPKVDVVFRPPPPPKVELPPPPAPKPVVAKVAPKPAAPAAMVAPKEIPKELPPEKPVVAEVEAREIAVGGTGDGSGTELVAKVEAVEAPSEVEATPIVSGPVQLPEEAEPPEELEGNVRPEFPESARANGVEGLVVLKIVVEKDGRVGKIAVMKGDEPFVAAAISAVQTWKYTPASLDGEAIAVYRVVKIPFRIKT